MSENGRKETSAMFFWDGSLEMVVFFKNQVGE